MSIIADKKDGKLTGRFRVQVMVNYQLIRSRRLATIGEARNVEAEWLALKAQGITPQPLAAPMTALAANTQAQEPSAALTLSQATRKAEGRIWAGNTELNSLGQLRIIGELMGDPSMDDIDTRWVMRLKERLNDERKVSPATLNRYLAVLSKLLSWSQDMGFRSVVALPKFGKSKEGEGRLRWISHEEEAQLLKLLPERTAKFVRFAILTGGRRGELLKIKPEDVHPDRVILWGEGTKSGKSRPVLLIPESLELAQWLFVQGNAPTQQMLRTDWTKVRKAMGLKGEKDFVFHACRHTFAVRAVEKGVEIRQLQAWMGHESIEMTEKYGKVSGLALANARDRMFAVAA